MKLSHPNGKQHPAHDCISGEWYSFGESVDCTPYMFVGRQLDMPGDNDYLFVTQDGEATWTNDSVPVSCLASSGELSFRFKVEGE